VMNQAWPWLPFYDGLAQRRYSQPARERSLQCPAHHFAREAIQNYGQVDKLNSLSRAERN
jgi:hypothetical protein